MMIKRMSKRGQGVNWLIGLFIVVIAALGIYMFWTYIQQQASQRPEVLASKIEICKGVTSQDTAPVFCDQFSPVSIGGETQLVNCQYPEIIKYLDPTAQTIECKAVVYNADGTTSISGALDYSERGRAECAKQFRTGNVKSDTKINDVLCSSLTCEQMGGKAIDKAATPSKSCDSETTLKKTILAGFSGQANKVCCVRP